MRDSEKLILEPAAVASWHYLPHGVREEIKEFLEGLAGTPPETWPPRVKLWNPHRGVYALSTWLKGHEMLVFIFPDGDKLNIEGLSMREVLDEMRQQAGWPS